MMLEMASNAIECRDLKKSFVLEGRRAVRRAQRDPRIVLEHGKARINAVDAVSFNVESGEIFGLLGPNGAGKTTVVKMLCTLLFPDSGEAYVDGFRVGEEDHEIRKRIGVVFGPYMNYHRLTGRDNLRFWGKLYKVRNLDGRINELAREFGMVNRIDDFVETYSLGMKCRLALMRGVLHDPEILFLDEPTLGLDPSAALKVREMIREMKEERGTTIFLCTHYLAEAEYLCDKVGIISNGRLAAIGPPSDLELSLKRNSFLEVATDQIGIEKIRYAGIPHVVERGVVKIPITEESDLPTVLSGLLNSGVPIKGISVSKATLEEVFVHFTSK